MTASAAYIEWLKDALLPLGHISVKRMFGGAGVYCDGLMFGLIADDVLYLKADASTARAYEDEGCGPFVYDGKTKPVAMSYWRLPERLIDEPDEFVDWARRSVGVARNVAAKAKPKPAAKRATKKREAKPRA
jgi:DNA transformation protein and related proteins